MEPSGYTVHIWLVVNLKSLGPKGFSVNSSILFSSILNVSSLISQKTTFAPLNKKALIVDENVNDGAITSSPLCKSAKIEAISSAVVPDVVKSIFLIPNLL